MLRLLKASCCASLLVTQSGVALAEEPDGSTSPPMVLSGGDIADTDRVFSRGYEEISPSAQISSEDGDFELDLALDYSFGAPPSTETVDGVKYITGNFANVALKLNVPLGEASSDRIDFGQFGRDGSAKLSFTYFMPRFPSGQDQKPYLQAMVRRCVDLAGQKWIRDERGERGAVSSFLKEFYAEFASGGTIRSGDSLLLEVAGNLDSNPFSAVAKSECAAGQGGFIGNEAAIVDYFAINFPDDEVLKRYRSRFESASTTFFTLEGGAGLNSFSIADEASFSVDEQDKLGFDFNANFGYVFGGGNTAVRGGVGYTRVFEAQDDVEFCRMASAMAESECINGQNGAPTRTDTGYAEVGLRHVISRRSDGSPSIAIAPTVTYIFEDDDFQAKFPLYLQQSDENGLDAGVQAIYNGKDDEFGIGVFVGVPFGLISR